MLSKELSLFSPFVSFSSAKSGIFLDLLAIEEDPFERMNYSEK